MPLARLKLFNNYIIMLMRMQTKMGAAKVKAVTLKLRESLHNFDGVQRGVNIALTGGKTF
jgi:hypothetical protein